MKTFHKILLTALFPCLCLIGLGVYALSALYEEHKSITTIYKDRVIPLRDLKTISDNYAVHVIDAVNKINDGLITAEDGRRMISDAKSDTDRRWGIYKQTFLTPKEEKLAASFEKLMMISNRDIELLLAHLQGLRGLVKGQLDMFDGELYATIDPLADNLMQLINLQLDVSNEEFLRSDVLINRIPIIITVMTLLSIITTIIVSGVIARQFVRKLGGEPDDVALAAQSISEGYLILEMTTAPIAGSVMQSMQEMSQKLQETIRQIKHSASELKNTSHELTKNSQHTAKELDFQQQQTQQVAVAMNEMAATVAEVARNTQSTSTATRAAQEQAEVGETAILRSIKAVTDLSNEVELTSGVITQLAIDSSEIGTVLEVIRNIAAQTNLLALNAAIEAARAGEQGRGFAVVADEVRTLASRTHSSTQEIQAMIAKIQTGITNAVQVMENGRNEASDTVDHTKHAQQILTNIKYSVSDINAMTLQIASAAEEQSMVAEDINKNVVSINNVTDVAVCAIAQVEKYAQSLSAVSQTLQDRVGFFKLEVAG